MSSSSGYFLILMKKLLEEHQRLQKEIEQLQHEEMLTQRVEYLRVRVTSEDLHNIMNGDTKTIKCHLRVSAETFRIIVEYVPIKHRGWSPEYEVICFLYWMACGCSYRVAGGFMGMSRYTVSKIIHKMLDLFTDLRHLISPGTIDDYERIATKFCRRGRSQIFSKCVGAIDGTHVRVKCHQDQQDAFKNHKGSFTYQIQAVADSEFKFTSVFVRFPGSVHDTRVLKDSPI